MFSALVLTSSDRRIDIAGPEIKTKLLQKYGKWITKRDVVVHSRNDQDGRSRVSKDTEIEDGVIGVGFEEGAYVSGSPDKFLYITYIPHQNGPYDAGRGSDFTEFKTAAIEKHRQAVIGGMKSAPKTNPDPF